MFSSSDMGGEFLKGLSHEIEMNYKWYKVTEPYQKMNLLQFLNLSIASCIFILTFSFFRGIAKRLPHSLLLGQPSCKCL